MSYFSNSDTRIRNQQNPNESASHGICAFPQLICTRLPICHCNIYNLLENPGSNWRSISAYLDHFLSPRCFRRDRETNFDFHSKGVGKSWMFVVWLTDRFSPKTERPPAWAKDTQDRINSANQSIWSDIDVHVRRSLMVDPIKMFLGIKGFQSIRSTFLNLC